MQDTRRGPLLPLGGLFSAASPNLRGFHVGRNDMTYRMDGHRTTSFFRVAIVGFLAAAMVASAGTAARARHAVIRDSFVAQAGPTPHPSTFFVSHRLCLGQEGVDRVARRFVASRDGVLSAQLATAFIPLRAEQAVGVSACSAAGVARACANQSSSYRKPTWSPPRRWWGVVRIIKWVCRTTGTIKTSLSSTPK